MVTLESIMFDQTRLKTAGCALFVVAALALAAPAKAQTDVAVWDFEASNLTPTVDLNGGATASGGSGVASESFPAGDGSTAAWSFTSWTTNTSADANDYFQFLIDTTDAVDLTFEFAERRSGTGIRAFEVQYSTDGSIFTLIPATVTAVPDDTNFRSHSFDLSALDAIENQATLYLRVHGHTAEAAGGTWRIDDVNLIAAVIVPVELMSFDIE